jgi:ElaB/YqjD/DUF883 family membrane-anchored ribosome-binding protein
MGADRYDNPIPTTGPSNYTGAGMGAGQGSSMNPPADQAEGMVDQARQKGQEAMDQVKDKGQQAATVVGQKADQGIDKAADAAQGLADTLREKATTLPGGEKTTDLAYQAASGLERGADYLRDKDVDAMRGDLEDLIRRYPTQSIIVGLAAGFLLARAFR